MASILVVSGPVEGDYFLLGRRAVVIGRDDTCPIQIVDETVSRRHLQIRLDENDRTYCAQDMKSANGTFVNDRPISDDTPLADGDIIKLGSTELMFSAVDFADGETAFQHYRRQGEGDKSTIIRKRAQG